ncbi:hypothetical protein [uncultured Gimesia sp.]|jgi:hypothetical protein|uniref:hypothetical protein n=1 Tax=uncultured Gimesia sp. TaxID=1678688 RepID=UPI002621848B|nr:hypothetical protein [uncultured Gimesia sp.]
MVKLDLRKLSAPVEALRSDLSEAYKRLDAQWDEIEACLKALPIPCSVSYTYDHNEWRPEDFSCLTWKKWNGKKRICIEVHIFEPDNQYSDYSVTTTPYDEWSGEQRIEMLNHVTGLFEAAEKQTKLFIDKTKN